MTSKFKIEIYQQPLKTSSVNLIDIYDFFKYKGSTSDQKLKIDFKLLNMKYMSNGCGRLDYDLASRMTQNLLTQENYLSKR